MNLRHLEGLAAVKTNFRPRLTNSPSESKFGNSGFNRWKQHEMNISRQLHSIGWEQAWTVDILSPKLTRLRQADVILKNMFRSFWKLMFILKDQSITGTNFIFALNRKQSIFLLKIQFLFECQELRSEQRCNLWERLQIAKSRLGKLLCPGAAVVDFT